jgi:hypothetical protein
MGRFRQSLRQLVRSLSADTVWLPPPSAPGYFNRWEAESRSHRLLVNNLSDSQRTEFLARGSFDVIGGDTGKRYRIKRDRQMNIEELDGNGLRTKLLCFMPKGEVPLGDMMLAQKLALELFETEALGIAIRAAVREEYDEAYPFLRGYPRR